MSKSARPEREALWEAVLRAAGEVARRAAASEDGVARAARAGGRAVSPERRSQVVAQIVPPMVRPLLPRILHLLGESPIIVAPVILGAHTLGALNVAAGWLQPEDTRVVQAFADHAAIALGQARARDAS